MAGKNNSDAIRRASLKRQKDSFKEKELLIRNSLNSVDTKTNKKIIFDDDIDEQIVNEETITNGSKKKTLFDDDDEEEEDPTEEFDFSENKKAKVINLGNDPRFAMGGRFLEDSEQNISEEEEHNEVDGDGMADERQKQLEILESVLGKPLAKKQDPQAAVKRKNQMIRYDPTQDGHQKHELQKEEPQLPKKKKRKVNEAAVEEKAPVPVSSEIFYSVSDNLTNTISASEGFSLLQRFGAAPPETNIDKNEDAQPVERQSKIGERFESKNAFRYDSSDGEDEIPVEKSENEEIVNEKLSSAEETFFVNNSVFKEAEKFFKRPATATGSFRNLRRELKEIVRSKIRKNIRKTQTWKQNKINKIKPHRR